MKTIEIKERDTVSVKGKYKERILAKVFKKFKPEDPAGGITLEETYELYELDSNYNTLSTSFVMTQEKLKDGRMALELVTTAPVLEEGDMFYFKDEAFGEKKGKAVTKWIDHGPNLVEVISDPVMTLIHPGQVIKMTK